MLVDYEAEPDNPDRQVPNPAWRKLDRAVVATRRRLEREETKLAELLRASCSAESTASACTCGECVGCRLREQDMVVAKLRQDWTRLRGERRETPKKIRLGEVPDRDPVKLHYERKLFTDTIKLCAYEIETRLVEMTRGVFTREMFEGRALIRDILQATGDLVVQTGELQVHLEQLSTPRYTEAMISLCEQLNALNPSLVETDLRLRFFVKPRPVGE
jgi:hypothetical protein